MRIILYKSSLCPRCHLAKKALLELTGNNPEFEVELVDVLTSPRRTLQDGIRMIPALQIGDRRLSGVYLKKEDIARFLGDTA